MKMIMRLLLVAVVAVGCKTAKVTTQPTDGVQQITIKASPCFGSCPVFEMTFRSDRSANYFAQRFNKNQDGLYRTMLSPKDYGQLLTLLMATDFSNLKDEYKVPATDMPSMDLEIAYEGNKVKKIHDYGARGTDELKALYEYVRSLRETQEWEKME